MQCLLGILVEPPSWKRCCNHLLSVHLNWRGVEGDLTPPPVLLFSPLSFWNTCRPQEKHVFACHIFDYIRGYSWWLLSMVTSNCILMFTLFNILDGYILYICIFCFVFSSQSRTNPATREEVPLAMRVMRCSGRGTRKRARGWYTSDSYMNRTPPGGWLVHLLHCSINRLYLIWTGRRGEVGPGRNNKSQNMSE